MRNAAAASIRMATRNLKEKYLSFPVLLPHKGRLSAQPNFSLGTSNLGCKVLMYAEGGTAIFFISVFCYTRPLSLLEAGAVSGAALQ